MALLPSVMEFPYAGSPSPGSVRQLVCFQQVPELGHRGLVRHRLTAQINAHELPHPGQISSPGLVLSF